METHSKLPAIFQETTYGDLVTLPNVYDQNKSLLERAKEAIKPTQQKLSTDLTSLTPEELEALDEELNKMQGKLNQSEKVSKDRRMVFTGYFDRIKTLFTDIEKEFLGESAAFKAVRDNIARERIRRQQEEAKKQADAIAKKQEEVMYRKYLFEGYNENFMRLVATQVSKLNETFNAKTAEDLPEYGRKIAAWAPKFGGIESVGFKQNYTTRYHTPEEQTEINFDVIQEIVPQYVKNYSESLTSEVNRLVDQVDSRIKELNESDEAARKIREEKEAADRQAALDKKLVQQKEQLATQADSDLLNATFEVAANTTEPIGLTKNTTRKNKYAISSHAAMTAIIQQWVTNDMPAMSIVDLEKNLKFMITAANKRLNEGVKLEAKGLEVVEDVSTRVSKAK